eukprot:XP_014778421.1 PREDICTED: TRAF3-interacting protein 1-like [Octopus bimaculoides]
MDTKIFKRTQDTLGKIIVRPPLTDKLLAKPPFRFLHDIITSVIKSTGFMQGLYTSEEQNSDNVKIPVFNDGDSEYVKKPHFRIFKFFTFLQSYSRKLFTGKSDFLGFYS